MIGCGTIGPSASHARRGLFVVLQLADLGLRPAELLWQSRAGETAVRARNTIMGGPS